MPCLVLASGRSVQVEDGVHSFRRTRVDYAVEQFEAMLLDDTWIAIVHEMSMIERYTDTVQAQRSQEFRIC